MAGDEETPTTEPQGEDAAATAVAAAVAESQAELPGTPPEGDAPNPNPDPDPESDSTAVPDPSYFERLLESTTDPEERVAITQRMISSLPEDQRAELPHIKAAREADEQNAAAQKAEGERTARANAIGQHNNIYQQSVQAMDDHLARVKSEDEDLDVDGLKEVQSQRERAFAQVANYSTYTRLIGSVVGRIQDRLGGAIPAEQLGSMKAEAEKNAEHGGDVFDHLYGSYLDFFFELGQQLGEKRTKGEGVGELASWRKSEKAAMRAEIMKELQGDVGAAVSEPATPQGVGAASPEGAAPVETQSVEQKVAASVKAARNGTPSRV